MLNKYARALFTKIFTPVARLLLKLGISPDVVTVVGTLGVCAGALAFYPRHEFFWGTVAIAPGAADGDKNRAVEAEVTALGGHKSLYSDAYYDRETFDRLYGVANQRRVKQETDPDNRLTGLYEKAVNRR